MRSMRVGVRIGVGLEGGGVRLPVGIGSVLRVVLLVLLIVIITVLLCWVCMLLLILILLRRMLLLVLMLLCSPVFGIVRVDLTGPSCCLTSALLFATVVMIRVDEELTSAGSDFLVVQLVFFLRTLIVDDISNFHQARAHKIAGTTPVPVPYLNQ